MPEIVEAETAPVENSAEYVEPGRTIPNLTTLDDLRNLSAGSQIEITRLTPTAIKGYCGHLIVPEGGMAEVMEEIQSGFGGGKYQLRGKCLAPGGKLTYVIGAVQVDVAGYPRFEGKEYLNGVWRTIAAPAVSAQLMPVQNPGGRGGAAGLESMLGGFVQTALQGALSSEGGISMGDLPQLITAIAGLSNGGQQRDSFDGVERAFALMAKMQDARPEPAPAPASDDMGGLSSLLPMLMQKFAAPQQPAPPPMPPTPPGYPPYAQVSSEQMWSQMQRHPTPGPHPHPQYAAPPQQANWTTPPQPPQANGAPGYPPQAPRPTQPAPGTFSGHPTQPPQQVPGTPPDPGQEYDPLSVEDIMQDLAARDEKGRAEFIGALCEKLGLDDAIIKQMFPDGQAANAGGFTLNLPDP